MGTFLFLGVVFWIWFETDNTGTPPSHILSGVENANVQRLDIHSADTTLSLIRTEEEWQLKGTSSLNVEYAAVEGMLSKLLQATRSEALDVADSAPFGLQPPQVTITLVEEDNTPHRLDIGHPLQVSTDSYIRHESKIYTTAGRLAEDWHLFKTHIQTKSVNLPNNHSHAPGNQ